jgi:hypothetical protein
VRYIVILLVFVCFANFSDAQSEYGERVADSVAYQDVNFRKLIDYFRNTVWYEAEACRDDSCNQYSDGGEYFFMRGWDALNKEDKVLLHFNTGRTMNVENPETSELQLIFSQCTPWIFVTGCISADPLEFSMTDVSEAGVYHRRLKIVSEKEFIIYGPSSRIGSGWQVIHYKLSTPTKEAYELISSSLMR